MKKPFRGDRSQKTPVIRVTFKNMTDLILEQQEYDRFGNVLKFCSEYSIRLKDIKKVKRELIDLREFPVKEWEG